MASIKIKGMTCAHCVASVTKALSSINGIEDVHVSLSENQADFSMTKEVPRATIKAAIEKIGFEVDE
ncbi:heavy-metal-associated domain-containing protein [Desulfurivibrio alkaliphilus]|uniref:Heavy metal transport/detoxification protein n=1 Tax=Desulfurivibrio alkaliphilus (strain DSM 19089 / UNIQEM U267 / AHT2) TaxID=589865 RepID=D6Z0N1_DESAT|nr:heavy metal-associated domain-containing protein [Desulfurivibrio alkaliphilus]ADH85260.1 Heavy metal transport/detoxification protein [Desulfurivibrio alkaliphilus AHT 2]